MVTHQITWSGEIARHVAFVAAQRTPVAPIPSMSPQIRAHREIVSTVRSRVLALLADGRRHKRAEIDEKMEGLDLRVSTLRNTLYEMQADGVIVAHGATTNRWFSLF